jgi:hypothetical protein
MCDKPKLNGRASASRIDPCMKHIITWLHIQGITTLSCCCGHGRYPPSIVVLDEGQRIEIFSGAVIPRKKRFYVQDKKGYYYIPEAIE